MIESSAHVDDVDLRRYAGYSKRIHIWHHANIEHDVSIGKDTVVGSNVFIGRGTRIGNEVRIQHGAFICRGATLDNGVFVGPGAILIEDKHPRAGLATLNPQPPILQANCSIGAGAIIMPGVIVGINAVVGAGAVVTRNVPAYTTVSGIPASLHVSQLKYVKRSVTVATRNTPPILSKSPQ